MEIIKFPNTVLKNKSIAVDLENIPDSIPKLIRDMKETLEKSGGIGLAAPQVGHNVRVVLVKERVYRVMPGTSGMDNLMSGNIEALTTMITHTMVNPEIVNRSQTKYTQIEGCLSFPEVTARINRHQIVEAKWYDLESKSWKTKQFHELGASCVQHEIDHLDGILISDRIGPLKSQFTKEYFRKNK